MNTRYFKIFTYGMFIGFLAFLISFGIAGIGNLTGFSVSEDSISYGQNAEISADQSVVVPIILENHPPRFDLYSFGITGKVSEGSIVRVYIEDEGKRFRVYDSSKHGFSITGMTVDENSNAISEPVDQPATEEPVDQPVAEEPAEQPLEEQPALEEQTAEPVAEETNQTAEETITEEPSEQAAEAPVIEEEKAGSSIQEKFREFSEECDEACDLRNKGFNNEFSLIIEVDSGKIMIDRLEYKIIDLTKKIARTQNFEVDSLVYDLLESENGKAEVIIEFNDGESTHAQDSLSSMESGDLKITHKYQNINAVAAEIDASGFEKLASSGMIKRVYNDDILEIQLSDSAPLIGAGYAWAKQAGGVNITGSGQTICEIDTGVDYSHAALSGKIVDQKCWCLVSGSNCCPGGQSTGDNAMDDNGHGTHVAGILSSNDANYRGIAPGADIIAVKACNSAGSCASSDIISAIEYCTSKAQTQDVAAISMSIGGRIPYSSSCDGTSSSLTSAINNAVDAGIAVTIAAGNYNNSNGVSWPSCVEKATAVSASDKSDLIPDYSNRAIGVTDLLGVGSSINSLNPSNGFATRSGTSMATPHVAGAIALIQQYSKLYNDRMMSVSEIESLLKKTGKRVIDSKTGSVYYRVDVENAIDSILKIDSAGLAVERENYGKVKFDSSADLDAASHAFVVSENMISLDSSRYPSLNVPAELTIFNLDFEKTPIALKNGEACIDCQTVSYSNGSFTFHVNGFSNYSAGVNSNLSIWDSADPGSQFYSGNSTLNREISFFGHYINRSSMQTLPNASCSIAFSGNSSLMEFNASKGVYEFSRNFTSEGLYGYSVRCSGDSAETLNASDAINISKLSPLMILNANGQETNVSILKDRNVTITANLTDPADSISLYINDNPVLSGREISYSTSFSDYGAHNVSAVYSGCAEYYPLEKEITINVIQDTVPPQFSSFSDSYGRYGESFSLSVSVNDNIEIGSVWLEENFAGSWQNHTVAGAGAYSYSFSNLPIGNYSYRWFANDSSGNLNETQMLAFEVRKGNNPIIIYVNGQQGSATVNYGTSITVNASGKGNVTLFKDSVLISNPATESLSARTEEYEYFANSSGNENYSANPSGTSTHVHVNKIASTVRLKLNDNHGATTASSGNVKLKGEMITPSTGTVKIYKGTTLLGSGSSPYEITGSFSSGTYSINASYEGGTNYLPSSEVLTLTVSSSQAAATTQSSSSSSSSSSSGCSPNWKCVEWTECLNGEQTRTCSDINNCGTTSGKPAIKQGCVKCDVNWTCSEWDSCENGTMARKCSDLNNCGTATSKPSESQECGKPFFEKTTSEKLSGMYNKTVEFGKAMYGQIVEEPIIVLPIVALIGAVIFFVSKELMAARATLKKSHNFKNFIRKSIKDEMRHMRKRN